MLSAHAQRVASKRCGMFSLPQTHPGVQDDLLLSYKRLCFFTPYLCETSLSLSDSYTELTQTMASAHDVLYPSKDRTIALCGLVITISKLFTLALRYETEARRLCLIKVPGRIHAGVSFYFISSIIYLIMLTLYVSSGIVCDRYL